MITNHAMRHIKWNKFTVGVQTDINITHEIYIVFIYVTTLFTIAVNVYNQLERQTRYQRLITAMIFYSN